MVVSEANRVGTGAAASGVHAPPRAKVIVWLAAFLALWLGVAHTEEISGKVIRVADGDTITILDAAQAHHTIRLMGIDAPERNQPYGDQSRENLTRLTLGKEARLDCPKTDRYGRRVCKVWVQPEDCPQCGMTLDAGHAQITVGLAWWYRQYAKEQSEEDRGRYESDENEAHLLKRGLWADDAPVPSWEWRRERR